MATFGPTVLAYPVGTVTGSGIFLPGASTYNEGEGIYTSLQGVVGLIECNGYDECHLNPLANAAGTPTFGVWAFYGNKQNGAVHDRYTARLLLTATSAATGFDITWDGKTYRTKNPTVTLAFADILDNTVGCTSKGQTGTATIMGSIGISHLGGADYIAITVAAGATDANMLVRLG